MEPRMNGKNRFIRMMAAMELGKKVVEVTHAQYTSAKALFLAMAYDATPEVVSKLKDRLRNS